MGTSSKKAYVFRLILTISVAIGLAAVTFNLGQWQTGRAHEKQQRLDQKREALRAPALELVTAQLPMPQSAYRSFRIRGRWVDSSVVFLDNRQVKGRPAVQVVQGFQPEGQSFLIPVDRGYLLRNPLEPRVAPVMPNEPDRGVTTLEARVLVRFPQAAEIRGLSLQDPSEIIQREEEGRQVWSNFNGAEFAKFTGQQVANFVATAQPILESQSTGNAIQVQNGFTFFGVKLSEQVSRHEGYAFQWYAMTLMLSLFGAWFVFKEFLQKAR